MLLRVGKLTGRRVLVSVDVLGRLRDVYFDDQALVARYLIVDLGRWTSGRRVLVAPHAAQILDQSLRAVALSLSREQIESSPVIETEAPAAYQLENQLLRSFGQHSQWPQVGQWGTAPLLVAAGGADTPAHSHLRSALEVSRYSVNAVDGSVGHLADFIIDDKDWTIRYFIVELGIWPFAHQVMIAARYLHTVNWGAASVELDQTRQQIQGAADFDPDAPLPGEASAKADAGSLARRSRH